MASLTFRPEVRAEQSRSALGTIVLIRPLSFGALTGMAVFLSLAILSYLFVAEYAKKASLAGTLVPASGAIRVVAQQPGVVRERHVREGEHVTAGAALLRLVDPRATHDVGSVGAATVALAERRIEQTRRQRQGVAASAVSERHSLLGRIAGLEMERGQVAGELESLVARESLAERSVGRFDDLASRGFVSPAQRQQKLEESLEHRARRHAAERARLAIEREIASLRAALAESQAREDTQLSALEAQIAALAQERIDRQAQADAVVTAPEAGTVAAVLVEPGQVVGAATSLLTLLPDDSPLEAHLLAPSRAVGFIRAGQEVRLRYPAFPYQKFGSHRARVLSVSRSALAAAELGVASPDAAREPLYRVKVALEAQTVRAYGRAEPLQAGMQVEADVILDRRRLIEWVFEPLFSLAGRA